MAKETDKHLFIFPTNTKMRVLILFVKYLIDFRFPAISSVAPNQGYIWRSVQFQNAIRNNKGIFVESHEVVKQ